MSVAVAVAVVAMLSAAQRPATGGPPNVGSAARLAGVTVLADALAGWLVERVADRARLSASRLVRGSQDERALRSVGVSVAKDLAGMVAPQHRESFEFVLRDRLVEATTPAEVAGGNEVATDVAVAKGSLLAAVVASVDAVVRPLADGTMTGQDVSYLETIGLDAEGLRESMIRLLVRAVQREATRTGALVSMAAQLNADLDESYHLRTQLSMADLHELIAELRELMGGPPSEFPRSWHLPLVSDDGGLADLVAYPPPAAGSRDAEISGLCRLLEGPGGGTVLVTGDAFRGKTTVLAELTRRLLSDGGCDVVGVMNVRNASHLSTRPLATLNTQLVRLLGVPCGLASGPEALLEQHWALRDRATAASPGRLLVVLIDGLDEAPDPELLYRLLAIPPPPNCWVVVAGRPSPPLPEGDLLTTLPPEWVVDLVEIPEAVERRGAAEAWVGQVVSSTDRLELMVFAALVVAATPMSRPELAELLDADLADVNRVLGSHRHLPWLTTPDRDGRFRLAHDYLTTAVRSALGHAALRRASARLRAWVARYREAGWPNATPRFIIEQMPIWLASTGPVDGPHGLGLSLPERAELLTDPRLTERILSNPRSWRELVELGIAILEELAEAHRGGTDQFPALFTLALRIRDWKTAFDLPPEVMTAYADRGEIDLACDLARGVALAAQDPRALLALATHPAVPLAERCRLIDEARPLLPDIPGPDVRDERLSWGKALVTCGRLDEARAFTHALQPWDQARLLVALGAAGEPGAFDRARQIGRDRLPARLRVQIELDLRRAGHSKGYTEAERLANQVDPPERVNVLLALAKEGVPDALGKARSLVTPPKGAYELVLLALIGANGDPEALILARDTGVSNLERAIAAEQEAPPQSQARSILADRVGGHRWALAGIAQALVQAGRVDEARPLLAQLHQRDRAQVLVMLGRTGDLAALDEAASVAGQLDPGVRKAVLRQLMIALAETGHPSEAFRHVGALDPLRGVGGLVDIAETLLHCGRLDEALQLTARVEGEARGRLDEVIARELVARGRLDEAVDMARGLGAQARALTVIVVGSRLAEDLRVDEARRLSDQWPEHASKILRSVAEHLAKAGRFEEALGLASGLDTSNRSAALEVIGQELAMAGQLREARLVAKKPRIGQRARVLLAGAEARQAPGLLAEVLELALHSSHHHERDYLLRAIAGVQIRQGRLSDAVDLAARFGANAPQLLLSVGRALAEAGRTADARSVAQRLRLKHRVGLLCAIGEAGDVTALDELQPLANHWECRDDLPCIIRALARAGRLDAALDLDEPRRHRAGRQPVGPLGIGHALAGAGRFDQARQFISHHVSAVQVQVLVHMAMAGDPHALDEAFARAKDVRRTSSRCLATIAEALDHLAETDQPSTRAHLEADAAFLLANE
jgi:hypothetical protein